MIVYLRLCVRAHACVGPKIKRKVLKGRSGALLSTVEAFVLGAVAKAVATTVTMPIIRVKVLQQLKKRAQPPVLSAGSTYNQAVVAVPEATMVKTLVAIYRMEGFAGLYVGLSPQLLKGVLASAVLVAVKERVYGFTKRLVLAARAGS